MADDDDDVIRKFQLLRELRQPPGWASQWPAVIEQSLAWLRQHRGDPQLAEGRARMRAWLLEHLQSPSSSPSSELPVSVPQQPGAVVEPVPPAVVEPVPPATMKQAPQPEGTAAYYVEQLLRKRYPPDGDPPWAMKPKELHANILAYGREVSLSTVERVVRQIRQRKV